MARSYHNNKNIDIGNVAKQRGYFAKQQLPRNDTNNHKISGISKPTKEQEYENSFERKSLRENITSQPKNPDLIYLGTDLKKRPFSQIITCIKILRKKQKKNPEIV